MAATPKPDGDLDGVDDEADRCPGKKETINGNADDDGCPDTGPVTVVVRARDLELKSPLAFDKGSSTLTASGKSVLAQLALTLKANPGIRKVRIEVFVTELNAREDNNQLSLGRAQQLERELTAQGVAKRRLEIVPMGTSRPLDPSNIEVLIVK